MNVFSGKQLVTCISIMNIIPALERKNLGGQALVDGGGVKQDDEMRGCRCKWVVGPD